MITAEVKNRGESGGIDKRSVEYVVIGTEDHAEMTAVEAMQAVAGSSSGVAPETIDDGTGRFLVAKDVQIKDLIITPSRTIAFVSAEYGTPEAGSLLGGDDTTPPVDAVYEFSYQAQSTHILYALATRKYGTGAPDFGNKIRVRLDGHDLVHEGMDLPAGNTTNVWRLTVPKGFMTSTYESLVESLMGNVNSASFKGRPAGTMRLVNVQSSQPVGGTLSIAWGFQHSPNRTGLTIGGVSGVDIGGHEEWWTYDRKTLDLTANQMVLATVGVYVNQVHPTADLNQLGF